jgi:hypothetical protein
MDPADQWALLILVIPVDVFLTVLKKSSAGITMSSLGGRFGYSTHALSPQRKIDRDGLVATS